ncbi:hypothetical protein DH2020_025591 [Rehmannia glutinosa]|uniref:NB-ARC domain-containing protein n=1 Tax=Rehmannia glutinosa TaxID=99300 RepID=A0ABR0W2Y9_REHGL
MFGWYFNFSLMANNVGTVVEDTGKEAGWPRSGELVGMANCHKALNASLRWLANETWEYVVDEEPSSVHVKDVEFDIPSFDKYVYQVVGYLHQDGIRSIGIVGPIGVGKTTVMEKLNNQLKDTIMSSKHDIVIWVDYPKRLDAQDKILEMMQDVIIGRMKLIMGNADSKVDIISTVLCDRKIYLAHRSALLSN